MTKFSLYMTITVTLMVVATAVSSATATLDGFKGGNFQGPKVGELIYSRDNGRGVYVTTIAAGNRKYINYQLAQDGVGEDPAHLGEGGSWDRKPEFGGSGFLTLDFVSGLVNVREIGVVDLISDANKWRQTYSKDGVLEFWLDGYSASIEKFSGSGDGSTMIASASPDISRFPFLDLEGRLVDNGVSVSYQDSPTVPLPMPSAVWLFGSTLVVFVVLSTRRQV